MTTYSEATNKVISAASGIDYAYREVGDGAIPVVLLQHFRGNLDNWDPALIDAHASSRRVVAFDNVGVGMTMGTTPGSVVQMAHDVLAFLSAMDFDRVDLLGFSIGSSVAQEIALLRPDILRRLILASSAPKGAAGMHGWAPNVIAAVGPPEPNPDGYLDVFFARSTTSRQAGQKALERMMARQQDRDRTTTWETRLAHSTISNRRADTGRPRCRAVQPDTSLSLVVPPICLSRPQSRTTMRWAWDDGRMSPGRRCGARTWAQTRGTTRNCRAGSKRSNRVCPHHRRVPAAHHAGLGRDR